MRTAQRDDRKKVKSVCVCGGGVHAAKGLNLDSCSKDKASICCFFSIIFVLFMA